MLKVGLTDAEWQQLRKTPMHRLREFYQRYRQHLLTDSLMYLVLFQALALLFSFFR